MSADKLSLEIAALEKQSSKAKNAVIKKVLLKKIDKLKVELEAITSAPVAKAKIQRAKTKISQMSPKEFADYIKKLSKDPKYSFLKGMSSDEIARDVKRTAKPVGWRFRGRQNFKTPTKRDVKDNNNVYYENRRNRSDVSRSLRLETGGGFDGWENLSNVKPNNIEISETSAFGNPDKLILKYNGKQIAKFYYNMRGYNSDFSLKNSEGLYYGFGGDKPKSKQVSEFKKALKEGFTFIKGSKYKNGGGIDINELNMPVIRTQFEDEDYEFEDGGEITANERMQSLKNYPKLKF